ncbi:MAG: hypothetical protein ACLSGI_03530 [Butyricicoccaceae bacterium]
MLVLTTLGEDGQFSGERAHRLLNTLTARAALMKIWHRCLHAGLRRCGHDFEYVPPEDADAYAAFVRSVRERLSPAGYTVLRHSHLNLRRARSSYERTTMRARLCGGPCPADDHEWGYALSAPMAVAPINKVEQVVRFAVSQVPPDKLFMGIPNYGYD